MMHIPSLKATTKAIPIKTIPPAETLYLPLSGYKETLTPIVAKNTKVKKYQTVATSNGVFAARLHAPVSGTIKETVSMEGASYLILINDFEENTIQNTPIDSTTLTTEDILNTLKESGIEGSGGAKFPAHTKYNTRNNAIEYLIINGAECEPYLSADYIVLKTYAKELLQTIIQLQKVVNANKIVFGIEKQHNELKTLLLRTAKDQNIKIKVVLLPNEYPQGGELQLIKSVTKKELPKGSIPAQHGIIVSNVGTLWAMYNALYNHTPYTKRMITISGEKASNIGNYEVHIGTPIAHILEHTGLPWNTDHQTVILGGPMMGKAVHSPNISIHKGSGGILTLPNPQNKRYNCIQCGYCTDVCPQHLMPMEFARHHNTGHIFKLSEYHINDCIECGACAYICPSDVPLMASIFAGKKLVNNQ